MLVHGQSITDACIDWETTEKLIVAASDVQVAIGNRISETAFVISDCLCFY